MIYLVDTNVLLRLVDRMSPQHGVVRSAGATIRAGGHALHTVPQNAAEFWNVATRPAVQNGLGVSPVDADRMLRLGERVCPLLPDLPAAYSQWRRLVVAHAVAGVQVHDAKLVVLMLVYGITHILTFNTSDFTRYSSEGIIAVDPGSV